MNTRHEQEKKQFRQLFSSQGINDFEQRFQVLDTFLKTEQHVSASDVARWLKQEGHDMALEFVQETLDLLCRLGFAHELRFDEGEKHYEHRHLGMHHDHMICVKCGRILEFKDEALEKKQCQVASAYGFHMLQHRMDIYGLCAECMADRQPLMPLSKARPGETCVIQALDGGRRARMRLSSLGLRPGDHIEVVSSLGGGQMVVAAGDNRFAVCRGLAGKIQVRHDACRAADRKGDCAGCTLSSIGKIPLSRMKQGQSGIIVRVGGESLLRRRLLEMGINRGTRVYVEKYAPLKDPLELIVKGYHVSLRVEEAEHILVEDVEAGTHP